MCLGEGARALRLPWRAGLAQLPVSLASPLWARVFWDGGCQLLELPADWAKALLALESCLLQLPPQLPSANPPSCRFKAPNPSAGPCVPAEQCWARDWPGALAGNGWEGGRSGIWVSALVLTGNSLPSLGLSFSLRDSRCWPTIMRMSHRDVSQKGHLDLTEDITRRQGVSCEVC